MANFFTDGKGTQSMRRLLAFLFALTTIGAIIGNIKLQNDWKIAAVTVGIPMIGSLLMMFFTSWSDVAKVANAVRK